MELNQSRPFETGSYCIEEMDVAILPVPRLMAEMLAADGQRGQ
jgi:hypothetical protein